MDKEEQSQSPKPSDSTSSRHRSEATARQAPQAGFATFWFELKRRKVMRVAVVYAVVAWLVIQIAATTFPSLSIPDWALSLVIMCVILGFPVSVVLAWAFELTPEGIKTTKVARDEHSETAEHAHVQSKRNWLALAFAAGVPTLIFGALVLVFFIQGRTSEDKSIAVLPLENMSPDPDNAFFADGVQEDILTNLSKIKDLLVISRSSTLQYRNPDRNLKQVGEELGVRYLVEGSVRRAGNQVLVTAQLIDTHTDGHLWAGNYNRSLDDIFAIQAAIAKEIAEQLKAVLSPDEIEKIEYRPTENQEAYDYFVKARQLFELTLESRGDEKAALLEMAVSLDPEFAEAWAHLATSYILWWHFIKNRDDPELQTKAHDALSKAKSLGPGLPDIPFAQSYFAQMEQGDYEASFDFLLEALAIDPSFRIAQSVIGMRYRLVGRLVEAQHFLEASIRTDPISPSTNRPLLTTYELRGKWDNARDLIQVNLKRTDGDELWRRKLPELEYLQSGDKQAFIAAMEAIPGFFDDPKGQVWKALQSRDYRSALQSFDELNPSDSFDFMSGPGLFLNPLNLVAALIWFELGEKGKWLDETQEAKTYLEEIVDADPRGNPRDWSCLPIIYALEDERDRMESTIAKVRELTFFADMNYTYQARCETNIAIAYLVLGDHDKAIETLNAACKMESPAFLNRRIDLWFIFDRLRGNEKFDELLKDEGRR